MEKLLTHGTAVNHNGKRYLIQMTPDLLANRPEGRVHIWPSGPGSSQGVLVSIRKVEEQNEGVVVFPGDPRLTNPAIIAENNERPAAPLPDEVRGTEGARARDAWNSAVAGTPNEVGKPLRGYWELVRALWDEGKVPRPVDNLVYDWLSDEVRFGRPKDMTFAAALEHILKVAQAIEVQTRELEIDVALPDRLPGKLHDLAVMYERHSAAIASQADTRLAPAQSMIQLLDALYVNVTEIAPGLDSAFQEKRESFEREASEAAAKSSSLLDQAQAEEHRQWVMSLFEYDPAAAKKKPKPSSIEDWFIGNFQGREAWSDGKIIDLGKPHLSGWETRLSTIRHKPDKPIDVEHVVPTIAQAVELAPLALWALENQKEAVLFKGPGDQVVTLDMRYVRYFRSKYAGARFVVDQKYDGRPAASVFDGDSLVGVVMPMRSTIDLDEISVALREKAALMAADAAPAMQATTEPPAAPAAEKGLTPAEDEPPEAPPAGGKITDVGENLWFNRRNFVEGGIRWENIKDLNDTLKVREAVKSKVWPRPNYEQLVEDGLHPFFAHIVKQVYDGISTAPKTRGAPSDDDLQTYIDTVYKIREATLEWIKEGNQKETLEGLMNSFIRTYGVRRDYMDDLKEAGNPKNVILDKVWPLAGENTYGNRFHENKEFNRQAILVGGNRTVTAMILRASTAKDAFSAISEGWPAKQEAWQKSFRIAEKAKVAKVSEAYRYEGTARVPVYLIEVDDVLIRHFGLQADADEFLSAMKPWLLLDKKTGRLRGDHPTQESAVAAARELVKRGGGRTFEARGMNIGEAVRTGPVVRQAGENISAQQLMDTFGFKGVNFGREGWIKQDERQAFLNHTYDSLMDMAELLNISPKDISLGGQLGIAFGAQGRGGEHAAHFVPGVNELNLTRTQGAGPLAHEFGHAFDHRLAVLAGLGKDPNPFLSDHAKRLGNVDGIPAPLLAAYKAVMSRIHYRDVTPDEGLPAVTQVSAEYHRESVDKDRNKGGKIYWSQDREMFARAFELYIADKLEELGRMNTFLSNTALIAEAIDVDESYAFPYPRGEERKALFHAMERLVANSPVVPGKEVTIPVGAAAESVQSRVEEPSATAPVVEPEVGPSAEAMQRVNETGDAYITQESSQVKDIAETLPSDSVTEQARWDALPAKERNFLVRGISNRETAHQMSGKNWADLNEQERGTATRIVDNNAQLIRALTSGVVSADEYPTEEVAASYSHISHHPNDAAKLDRNAFLIAVQSEYDAAAKFAETNEQKAVLAEEIEAFKDAYLKRESASLVSRGNAYSAKIAGRGNLDSKSVSRRNAALDRTETKFSDWLSGTKGSVKNAVLAARNEDQRAAEQHVKDDKATKRREAEKKQVAALLNFTKGDGSKFGTYPIARVTMGRDGYPSSVTVEADDLTDNKFDIVKTLFGGDNGKLRTIVDEIRAQIKVNQKQTGGVTLPDEKAAVVPENHHLAEQLRGETHLPIPAEEDNAKRPITLVDHDEFMDRLRDGKVSLEEYGAQFRRAHESLDSMKKELSGLTKALLLKRMGSMMASRYKNDTKQVVLDATARGIIEDFTLGRSYSYSMSSMNFQEVQFKTISSLVDKSTEEDLKEYARRVAEAREEHAKRIEGLKKAISNPETLEEFQQFIRYRKGGDGALTAEQRAKYDELLALEQKAKHQETIEARSTVQAVDVGSVEMSLVETVHTRDKYPLYVVQLSDRVERPMFEDLSGKAKQLGGWYSSFRGNGATPGFQFKDRGDAEKFIALRNGDVSNKERFDARQEEKKAGAVEKLREMADRLEQRSSESLGRDRLSNTARRARMAAGAEAEARAEKALAETMYNLASAIEDGRAIHLEGVRQKVQVELLGELVGRAKHDWLRKEYPSYADYEKHKDRPVEIEDVDFVEWPSFSASRAELLNMARAVGEQKNSSMLSAKLARLSASIGNDQRIEVERDIVEKILEKLPVSVHVPWHWANNRDNLNRLKAMNIESLPVLRAALREYVQYRGKKPEVDRAKELERALAGNRNVGIDFVPTGPQAVSRVMELAEVKPGMKTLDPSAGTGNIALEIRKYGVEPEVVEISTTLREILQAKNFVLVGQDFMAMQPEMDDVTGIEGNYDRICMNPPFSNGMDIEHVRHAYRHLKPGGRLVSIMCEGPFFRGDSKAVEFRDWMESVQGYSERLPENSFMDRTQLRTSGVNTRIVVINKPEAPSLSLTKRPMESAASTGR